MSEVQKWIASISGAVVGQIAVLAFFYLLVMTSASSSLTDGSSGGQSKEVTIMLSKLVEQIEPEAPPVPEAAAVPEEEIPEPEALAMRRQFIDTDSNTARERAPENARFESDRNTTASTEFLPDPDQPQESGPTMKGEEKIPGLTLADQEYADGEITPEPVPPSAIPVAVPAPVKPETEAQEMDTAPSEVETPPETDNRAEEVKESVEKDDKPGEADLPPDRVAEKAIQPGAEMIGEEAKMAAAEPTFVDPGGDHSTRAIPVEAAEEDREAMATEKTEETWEPAAPEMKREAAAAPEMAGQSVDQEKRESSPPEPPREEVQRKLDESMFNPSYLAHRRKNVQNGDITTIGEGSVDAEATEVGRYKKAVHQAIGRKWHQYRRDNAEDVSFGLLQVKFRVAPEGYIRDLKIVKKEASELVTEFSLKAIVDAVVPPMPPEVARTHGSTGLEMRYNIIIY